MSEQSHDRNTRQPKKTSHRSHLLDLPLDEGPQRRKRARPLFERQRRANLRAAQKRGNHSQSWLFRAMAGVLEHIDWALRDLPAFIQRTSGQRPAARAPHSSHRVKHSTTQAGHQPSPSTTTPEEPDETLPVASGDVIVTQPEEDEAERAYLTASHKQVNTTSPTAQRLVPRETRNPGRDERSPTAPAERRRQHSGQPPPLTQKQTGTPTARPVARPTTAHPSAPMRRAETEDTFSTGLRAYFDVAMDRLEAEGVNINKLAQEARRINPAALLGSEGMPARSVSQLPNFLRNYGIAILCAIIIYMLLPQNPIRPTAWDGPANFVSETVQQTLGISTLPERPVGDYHLEAAPSLTAGQIDAILASYGSPAAGTGNDWVELGRQYDIDPAFAVAFFIHESTAGTNPGWAGIKPDGSTTHNVGNIICAGYPTCYGRFRDYPSWRVGIEDWYRLIRVEYLDGRNHQVVSDIIPIYAPAFENDVQQYRLAVEQMVDVWKQGQVP